MNITLPDRLFKLFALLGIIITGYTMHSSQTSYEIYQMKVLETSDEAKRNLLIEIYNNHLISLNIYFSIGLIMLVFSLIAWNSYERKQNSTKVRQNERIYSDCQSCGKEFSSKRQYGTNKDASINLGFCNDCYENGEYVNPSLTIQEVLSEAYKRGYKDPKLPLIFFTLKKRLESLDRWKRHEY